MTPAAHSCHACGKTAGNLQRCGRCKSAWFCNRECQVVARKELGHKGANCRPPEVVQLGSAPSVPASSPASPLELAAWDLRYSDLSREAKAAHRTNSRIGNLAAVQKYTEAGSVADLIGGVDGAARRADADQLIATFLHRLGDMAAAARAACSSLRAARASSNMESLVSSLRTCGNVAREAPAEMAEMERESREQERLSGSPPSLGFFDLSQMGRISLPTTPAALSRLGLAYHEAAVSTCDAALVAVGGRSPAAEDMGLIPSLVGEARARGGLGTCLYPMRGERQRSLEIVRQAVALLRQEMRMATGDDAVSAKRSLGFQMLQLGNLHGTPRCVRT